MTHGIGPQNGVRQALKELHAAIEEAKADVTGLFMLQYLYDHQLLPAAEKPLYTTFLASSFRTLRFGVHEAHGKGMALQFNYLTDKGAFIARPDGTFTVDQTKIKGAVETWCTIFSKSKPPAITPAPRRCSTSLAYCVRRCSTRSTG